jgi:hypothetical protein
MRALSNNENRTAIAFQTAELSIIEYDIFNFSLPLHIWNRKWKWSWWNFFIRFGVPDYWMNGAYYAPNPKILGSKLWAWFTNVTHRQTEPTVAIHRFIHEWICVKMWTLQIYSHDHVLKECTFKFAAMYLFEVLCTSLLHQPLILSETISSANHPR